MRTSTPSVPGCRYCRHYTPEGRRGGHCQQLGVLVKGTWNACSLAAPIFTPAWERLEEIVNWTEEPLRIQPLGTHEPATCGQVSDSDLETRPLSESIKAVRTNRAA